MTTAIASASNTRLPIPALTRELALPGSRAAHKYWQSDSWHPAANAFPLLTKCDPERFQELVQNIQDNGLVEPVVLYEGKVLDGRNRLLACKEAGITPRFEEFVPNGVGPVQWIAAKHTRRDLDASQRAAAALALLPLLEAEAKERQWKGVTLGQDCPKGKAREAAAGLTGASDGYVRDAKRIVEKDSSMLERLRDGEVTIQEAKRQLGFKQTLAAINSDESYEWYTPKKYIEAARKVLGRIELDPASCELANGIVKATRIFTIEDDGLKQEWRGRVWLNPPYGDCGPNFVTKLIQEYQLGNVHEAVLAVNSHCNDAAWFQPLWNYLLCISSGRPKFWKSAGRPYNKPNHGTTFVYLGPNKDRFNTVFQQFGVIAARYSVSTTA